MKRAEVAFAPAEVETATEADFLALEADSNTPSLVKGYIGPWTPDRARCWARTRPRASAISPIRASPTAPAGSPAPT